MNLLPAHIPVNDTLNAPELMIENFTLTGFSPSDADRIIHIFQAAISEKWAAQANQFMPSNAQRIDGLNLTLDPQDYETPDRLGHALAALIYQEIF